MTALKILIYDTNFVKGVSRMIGLIKIKYWQQHGCAITILCSNDGVAFYKTQLENITYIPIDYTYHISGPMSVPLEYIRINMQVLPDIKKLIGLFDVVYSQAAIIDFLFVPWVLKFFDKKIKWFVAVDNLVPPPHKRPGQFVQNIIPYMAFLVGNLLLKRTDGIFVVTDFLRDYYARRGYKVIKTADGYGIDIKIFKGKISSKAPKFEAVYCGRLHEAKGVFDLIEVVRNVVKKNKGFTLGIMGDGSENIKKDLYAKINLYGLENNIIFTGYIDGKQKGDILRNAGFFLFLSYDEGCPHAVIEAFAMNKLVVAYDLPIYHEVFIKYIKNGQMILFKERKFDTIASYILKLNKNNLFFQNKLDNYTWNMIVKNELASMQKQYDPS